MFPAVGTDPWFYFVHSFVPVPTGPSRTAVAGTAEYGERFVAGIEDGRLWGVQFHPEKSAATGLALLSRFVEVAERSGSAVASTNSRV
jgi:glutamine amidotransferase